MSGTWRGNWLVTRGVIVALLGVLVLATGGCGGGGSSGGGTTGTTTSSKTEGIDIPESVEAVPDDNGNGKPEMSLGKATIGAAAQLFATGTDYQNDTFNLKVAIQALDRFEMIEDILDAVQQTGYADPRVINKGPYAAMITFKEERGKTLEKWIVDSKMLVEDGKDVNKIVAWIDGDNEVIKAQFKIISAPTDTNPYGVWRIDAGFFSKANGSLMGTFVASCTDNGGGTTLLQVNESMNQSEHGHNVNGKLILDKETGKGIITYTEWPPNGTPYQKTVSYSYDANHVITKHVDVEKVFSRTSFTDIYMDYNVYTSTGDNVRKHKQFGMPVKYTDANGNGYYCYYGAWMGRHQLWSGPGSALNIPEGSTLVGMGMENDGVQYTLGKKYQGYLVEKTLVDANIADIKGEVLETWTNENFSLVYVNNRWEKVIAWTFPLTTSGTAYDTKKLISDPMNHKNVFVFKGPQMLFVNPDGSFGGYIPVNNDVIHVNISMPIFLTHNGTNWVTYTTVSYQGFEPTVSNPTPYTFTYDAQFYMHSKGLNYILDVSGTQTVFVLKKEIENVIQPGLEAEAINTRAFTTYDGGTYTFSYNATTADIKLLDANGNAYTQPIWYMKSTAAPTKSYSWNYAMNAQETWNVMVYLKKADGTWLFLDDPIKFAPVTIGGKTINSLAYDGHMFGIPDVWQMFHGGDWALTQEMKDKLINIPAGQAVTGSDDGASYTIKPLFGFRVLDTVTSGYTVAIDTTLTLAGIVTYVDPGIGDMPVKETILVQEGTFLAP